MTAAILFCIIQVFELIKTQPARVLVELMRFEILLHF